MTRPTDKHWNTTTLTAELYLRPIPREKMTLDTSGHYARPDLFTFRIKD